MRELGNLRSYGKDTQIGSYYPGMHETHVLLVDHDSRDLVNTVNLLELCQYRVTPVELASVAIAILSRGNVKFDMVIANINSPNSHGNDLLQQAVNMDLPIILMSVDDNPIIAMRALENGAFLYIKKPTTIEMINSLWQHVWREKTRMIGERNGLAASSFKGVEFNEGICQEEKHLNYIADNNMLMMKNQGKFKKKIRDENSMNEDNVYNSKNVNNNRVGTKLHTVWTKELHAKFMDVVKQLGPGRCFPKEIRDLMKVDGLTRMQVASHLQKCRNDILLIWRSSEEQNSNQTTIGYHDINGFHTKRKRFGSMPRLDEGLSCYDQVQESSGAGQSPQTHVEVVLPSNDVQLNMETGQIMNNISHQQSFGSMLPGQSSVSFGTTSSTKRKHPSEDFFVFQDMDCLIENYSAQSQGSGMSNSNPLPRPYHLNPSYQIPFVPSIGTQIHGSSKTSNFRVEESGTKDRE